MAFWTRLTPLEEDIIWVAGRALAFGDRVSLEVSSFSADVVVGVLDAVFLPLPESAPLSSVQEDVPESLPFSESAPLFSAQDDIIESLASSSSLQEQYDSVCSEETPEAQGSQVARDDSPDVAPESACPISSLACSAPVSASSCISQDEAVSVSSPQEQRCLSEEVSAGQRPEQTNGTSDNVAGPPGSEDQLASLTKDETTSSLLLESDALRCEQGLCGGRMATPFEGVLVQGVDSKVSHEEVSHGVILISEAVDACPFEQLDWGCLYEILSRCDDDSLTATSLVCREWLKASRLARRTWKLTRSTQVLSLRSSLFRFTRVQKLIFTGNASKLCLDDMHLVWAAERAPHLEHLEIEHCSKITDEGLAGVLRECPKLHMLILFKCGGVTGSAFKGTRCKLDKVTLNWCGKLTNAGLEALASACPQMCSFEMLRESRDASLASGLHELAKSCSGLVNLTLHRSGVTDGCLCTLAAGCTKLNMLSLSCENGISDAGMTTFLQRAGHVQELSLARNQNLVTLPCSRPGRPLKCLSLGWWLNVPDIKLQGLSKETSLEQLHFLGCPKLSDATVAMVLNGCKKLSHLVVSESPLVTPQILESYARSGSRATFEIEKCEGIPADAFSEELRLSGRVMIS